MAELGEALGQPIDVTLNGKTYTISPLTIGDQARMAEWAERQIFAELRERLKSLAPEEKELRQILQNKMLAISAAEVTDKVFSLGAIYQKMFLMLRHRHPEITLAEVENITPEDYRKIQRRLYGEVDVTEIRLFRAVQQIVSLKAKDEDATKAEAELQRAIEDAVTEARSAVPFGG
jgi:hypothetical protein